MKRRTILSGISGMAIGSSALSRNTVLADTQTITAGNCEDCTAWLADQVRINDKQVVHLPAGNFSIAKSIDITGSQLIGSGADRTNLVYTGPAEQPLFTVGCRPGSNADIRDLTLIRDRQGGGTAISIEKGGSCYFEQRRRVLIDNIGFRGSSVSRGVGGWVSENSWDCCIDLGDAWGTHIGRIDAIGGYDITRAPTQPDRSVFLRTGAASGILSARITAVTVASFYRAIEIGPKTFFFIRDCDFAACYDGIISTHGPNDGFSEGRLESSLINAQRIGIHIKSSAWREINGISINRHKAGYKSGDWVGLKLEGALKSWIGKMRFQIDTNSGQFNGRAIGIHMINASDLIISECMFGIGLNCATIEENCSRINKVNNSFHNGLTCGS